jgi:hypothetical protein
MVTAAPARTQPLAGDDLARLLELVDEADSVELKLTVADSHRRSTVAALDIDPLDVQMRQVFFFDTPVLDLERRVWSCGCGGSRARATTRWSSCAR